jgi:hypothetical protein
VSRDRFWLGKKIDFWLSAECLFSPSCAGIICPV